MSSFDAVADTVSTFGRTLAARFQPKRGKYPKVRDRYLHSRDQIWPSAGPPVPWSLKTLF